MPQVDEVRSALARHRAATLDAAARAAVAMVLRPGAARRAEVLLIERARKEGDPWSGHMAFPGGRQDPEDPDPRTTAERETLEEVGMDLSGAELLGRLDDLGGRHGGHSGGLVISAFVYHVPDPPRLVPNEEVESAFWFPLGQLLARERHVDYPFRSEIGALSMPGVRVGPAEPHVVWGLTYRFLEHFFELLGRPLPSVRDALAAQQAAAGRVGPA